MQNMERVTDTNISDVYENDMTLYLAEFCREQNIESMKDESQAVWNAALMYIKRHVFNEPGCLKSKVMQPLKDTSFPGSVSTCNAYDYDLVNRICDYYIYMCMSYDKEISGIGFSLLTGINRDTIYDWGRDINKLSSKGCEIAKKLSDFREESLSAKLATAKRNPVGILAILNRHYNWNLPGVSREHTSNKALTAAELPQLGGQNGENTSMLPDSGADGGDNKDANE